MSARTNRMRKKATRLWLTAEAEDRMDETLAQLDASLKTLRIRTDILRKEMKANDAWLKARREWLIRRAQGIA